jgi:hypothetical protein
MIESRHFITTSNKLALGCSHTYGVGVEPMEAWPCLLAASNFGTPGCSADYLVRRAPGIITLYKPTVIYILWPDWTRFEYIQDERYHQSLTTDNNRIEFMESHPDSWLLNNFQKQTQILQSLCNNNNVQLIGMTLYDLIPYIDHADCWPVSKLGHHYAPTWHQQVADIFKNTEINNIKHPLAND